MKYQADYKTVSCLGNNLAYIRSGKGETILLVHGITTYSFIWRKIRPELEKAYDVISIDLLGCGHSDLPASGDLSLKHHAEIIADFIEKLGLKKVHFIGHDLGGGIAQIMAVKYRDKIASLTMLNPVGYDFWPVQPISAMRTPVFKQFAMAAFDIGFYRTIVRRALYRKESYTEELLGLFWSTFETKEARKSFLLFAKCLDNSNLMELETDLKKLELPVLIVRAEKDVYLSTEITEKLHENIPGSTLKVIPRSGHYIQEDAPLEVISAILEFLGRID